jgi:hypothetical protein
MRQSVGIKSWGSWLAFTLYALAAAACVIVVYVVVVWLSAPKEEIVTKGAHAPAPTPTPIIYNPQLKQTDPEVEQAGDRIAEVEVCLRKRQSAAALAALGRARRATSRALESRKSRGERGDELASTLKGLDAVERAIQRGQFDDAHRQLIALNNNLDRVDY